MKKSILLLFVTTLLTAQDLPQLSKNLFKIDILTPGVTFERSINSNSTIFFEAATSIGFVKKSNEGSFIMAPLLKTQYRYYYNLSKRLSNNKNISRNSGNFLAPFASYYFEPFNNENYISNYDGLTIGSTWGLQRTYKSGLNINLNTGLGYNFSNKISKTVFPVVPIINFTIGWVIFNNQK